MMLANPIWLVSLLPWLGVAIYLLWGRRKQRNVPFLELWRGPAATERAKWKISSPPIALALVLSALFAAILGAAGPGYRFRDSASPVTIVLDHGMTMSARGQSDLRFREAGRSAARELAKVSRSHVPVHALVVPATDSGTNPKASTEQFDDPNAWARSLDTLLATAVVSTQAVAQTVRTALASHNGLVVVVSDATLGIDDRRVVQVVPDTPLHNVAITRIAARIVPVPQVMVRVRNDSGLRSATLELDFGLGGDGPLRRVIDLPPTGAEQDYFFDSRKVGSLLTAAIDVLDDLPADNKAWLVREAAWPRVEVEHPVPALSRLLDIYRSLHPPGEGSRLIRIVSRADDLRPGDSGVVDALSAESSQGRIVRPTHVLPHPITQAVQNWLPQDLSVIPAKYPDGWTPILSAEDQTLIAVHESGNSRQVWCAIDTAAWANQPEFVEFWTAALDWVSGAAADGDAYACYALEQFDPSWQPVDKTLAAHPPGTWPGLYKRADGALRAFNVAALASPVENRVRMPAPDTASSGKLSQALVATAGHYDLSPVSLLAALMIVLLATLAWRKAPTRA